MNSNQNLGKVEIKLWFLLMLLLPKLNSEKKIQSLTDDQILELENRDKEKEKEIMTV